MKNEATNNIIGTGSTATAATSGDIKKNTAPIVIVDTVIWIISLAPLSKKRSSWLISSFKIAVTLPNF